MDFTSLSVDPSPIIQMTFDQIENEFVKRVFAAETDYAVKIIAKSDKHLSNGVSVCNQLILCSSTLKYFSTHMATFSVRNCHQM